MKDVGKIYSSSEDRVDELVVYKYIEDKRVLYMEIYMSEKREKKQLHQLEMKSWKAGRAREREARR